MPVDEPSGLTPQGVGAILCFGLALNALAYALLWSAHVVLRGDWSRNALVAGAVLICALSWLTSLLPLDWFELILGALMLPLLACFAIALALAAGLLQRMAGRA